MMVFLILLFGEEGPGQGEQHVQRERGEAKYNVIREIKDTYFARCTGDQWEMDLERSV